MSKCWKFKQASLNLRFVSEKTWRRFTRCSSGTLGTTRGWRSATWTGTREFVILVPDPIVFAPWSVLHDVGEPSDSCPDTSHEASLRGQTGKSDVHQQPIAGVRRAGVGVKVDPLFFVVLYLFCPMPYLKFTGGATLAMRWVA